MCMGKLLSTAATAALFLVAGIVPSIALDPVGPWSPEPGRPDTLGTHSISGNEGGFVLSLLCSATGGFSAELSSSDIGFERRVLAVVARVGRAKPISLQVDQSQTFPAMIGLKNIDPLERTILSGQDVSVKVTIAQSSDVIQTFHFADLAPTAAKMLKLCPPF